MAETFTQGYALLVGVGQSAVRNVVAPRHRQGRPGDPSRPDRPGPLRLSRRSGPAPPRSNATRDAILEGLDWLAEQVPPNRTRPPSSTSLATAGLRRGPAATS